MHTCVHTRTRAPAYKHEQASTRMDARARALHHTSPSRANRQRYNRRRCTAAQPAARRRVLLGTQDQLDALSADLPGLEAARKDAAAALDAHKQTRVDQIGDREENYEELLKRAEERLLRARERQKDARAKFGMDMVQANRMIDEYAARGR